MASDISPMSTCDSPEYDSQRCKFIYEDMDALMNIDDDEDYDSDEDTYTYNNELSGFEKILDVVAQTDKGIVVQELASIIFSLYQQIGNLSKEFQTGQKQLKLNLLESESKLANSMRKTGFDLVYLPVPFKTGAYPRCQIKNLRDISVLTREELHDMLHGYGVSFDSANESLKYQRQRLASALGLDPNCIIWLGMCENLYIVEHPM